MKKQDDIEQDIEDVLIGKKKTFTLDKEHGKPIYKEEGVKMKVKVDSKDKK